MKTEEPLTGIPLFLDAVGDVFTAALGWMGTVVDTITGSPILMLFCIALPLTGLGIGMFKRLLSARG